MVGGHLDKKRGNVPERISALGVVKCNRFNRSETKNRLNRDEGSIPHDCLSTKQTSGYPIFSKINGKLYLVGIHNSEFISRAQPGSDGNVEDVNSPGRELNVGISNDDPTGALNAATAINGEPIIKTLRSLYPTKPASVRSGVM